MNRPSNEARLIFAGGGTGGHLYPAIAIANRVREMLSDTMSANIIFVGTQRGLEYRIREQLGYPLHIINIRGIVRSLTLKNLLFPFLVLFAYWKALRLIGKFKPHVVVGTGGYVAWPVARAALTRRIPLLLQEQNSYPGMVTRKLAARADRLFLGFAGARAYLSNSDNITVVGNPVRREISQGDRAAAIKAFSLDSNKKTILILGGSQGARAINRAILNSLKHFNETDKYQLLWQTGKRDHTEVVASAGDRASGHTLFPFARDMSLTYAAADLAIARAGALTLAELQACRLPAILVPYPHAAGDHQMKNAEELVSLGCAKLVLESDLSSTDLLARAVELMQTGEADTITAALNKAAPSTPAVDIIANEVVCLVRQAQEREESIAG